MIQNLFLGFVLSFTTLLTPRSKAAETAPPSPAIVLPGQGLAQHDFMYAGESKELFAWLRATLFDPATGRISDAINLGGRINRMALTYNQGTFAGAANLLGHHDDAKLAASFTMNELCRDGYFPRAGEKGDGGGFNGIGARWIARFMKNRNEQSTFEPWLQKNAEAAWPARRASDNLTWPRWPQPTPEGTRYSWGSSSAVVVQQVTPPTEPAKAEPEKVPGCIR